MLLAHAIEIEPKAKNFFALCQRLYVFFKRQFASNVYEGQTLKRLLVQRWTGHLCALAVKKSRQELIDALVIVAESHRCHV